MKPPVVLDHGEAGDADECVARSYGTVIPRDERDEPLPGYTLEDCQPIHEDGVDVAVRWRERRALPVAAGAADGAGSPPLKVRFTLKNVRLCAYRAL